MNHDLKASSPWKGFGKTFKKFGKGVFEQGYIISRQGCCTHEIKRLLLLGRKAMTNLESILKAETSLSTKVYIVKAMFSPYISSHVWMCELDHKEG